MVKYIVPMPPHHDEFFHPNPDPITSFPPIPFPLKTQPSTAGKLNIHLASRERPTPAGCQCWIQQSSQSPMHFYDLTSCRRPAATICLRPLHVDNIFVFIRQVAPRWLFKTSATTWPFDLENGVRVTCDVGYLCANFSLPRPLCSRLRPDVCDRQTSDRQKSDVA